MSFDWTDYLTIADKLIALQTQGNEKEACHRVAISRAYYAAFHKAMEAALDFGLLSACPSGPDAHMFVFRAYAHGKTRNHEIIADDLDTLRKARNKADYETAWSNAATQSNAELRKARRILQNLNNLS